MKKISLLEEWVDDDGSRYADTYSCYFVNEIPEERCYFDYGDDKGYVIQVVEDEIANRDYKKYTIYYEKNLDDWNNQIIDVAEVCSICIKK